ncbi:hypothetical protein NW765_017720 [Fusarium oxysporum]|nr:hypothetical protein NW765_017720 [Fusarium oxysporum]
MTYDPETSTLPQLENVVATSVVDGLSRSGLIPNHNGSRFLAAWTFTEWTVDNEDLARTLVRASDPKESFSEPLILKPNMTQMVMKATYKGYVMQSISWFDYLSIVALLAHAFIAFVHSGLLLYSRATSGAWDTILELMVLVHRSEPPPDRLLSNTSAGVTSSKTVKLLACVEAPDGRATGVSDGDLQPRGELQMKLRNPGERRNPSLKPSQIGRTYGSPTRSEV